MSVYMYQASYSGDAIKALVNNPQDRTGAARAAIEANGGTMIGAWMAFGEDDLLVIADMPDDESMAGVALAISSCLLYTSPSPRDKRQSRMPSSA